MIGRGREGAPALPPASGGRHGLAAQPRDRAGALAPQHVLRRPAGDGCPAMGSCQGLGVGLGDCPPQVGGSPLYQTCFLPFFPLWAQVLPQPWGWGWGPWHGAGLAAHGLGGWRSASLIVSGEQGAGDPWRHCEQEALPLNSPCILSGGLWGSAGGLCHQALRAALCRGRPQMKGSQDPTGRLSHQKLMSLMPQRCEGRAGVRRGRPSHQGGGSTVLPGAGLRGTRETPGSPGPPEGIGASR